ncbi:PA2779 family protein [Noviherbaspirillum sp. CPCC 100848]|uniref:PA2779 family protein n=1 Tax=Noviherbaspirillum album TaxID=3080276 RepID=A0ABU6J282_9BURK|nr:PA2779 family protein [Noviherbaspirillum sp. CPCC 100848]MEC4717727.1 PA2779 family protein [Noviherbaspirillum sp. CPCC 100848]
MNAFKRFTASMLVVCVTGLSLPLQAGAAIVSTQEAAAAPAVSSTAAANAERDRVIGFLSREEVRQSIEAQGVDPQDAIKRVQAMSDEEVQQLAGRIDQLPAGGNIIGVLFTVFIVLLVTDILGLTKVFPFTRSIR